ncbi:hypothetical protein [Tellurirhabdus bombi]|uniref:hypothetical protein n=1 Tax=Tellurirhabdus bombi TaxID=2907205 RepID=UPI001F2C10C5|nr:hypothetical protein [Tellurirhabdus bombi]
MINYKIIALLLVNVILFLIGFNLFESFSIIIFIYLISDFINKFSREIVILELIAIYAFLCWLISPILCYYFFDENSYHGSLWGTYMPIDSVSYLSYSLPAVVAFVFGLRLNAFNSLPISFQEIKSDLRSYLKDKGFISTYLCIIGISCHIIALYVPSSIKSILEIIAFSYYAAIFYAYYSNYTYKKAIILICVAFILYDIVRSGMFGNPLFVFVIGIIIICYGADLNYKIKYFIFGIGIIFIALIQSLKADYRAKSWSGSEKIADTAYMYQLVTERIANPKILVEPDHIYGLVNRFNNGLYVARAIQYVPINEPYAYGETILISILSTFVPRFAWVDKPKTGGEYMTCRFLGDCLHEEHSYNIGILGEAYVNFSSIGGCVFMFFYGLLLNYLFSFSLRLYSVRPTIILWLPILWVTAVGIETDFLTVFNSFMKSALIVFILYKSIELLRSIKI